MGPGDRNLIRHRQKNAGMLKSGAANLKLKVEYTSELLPHGNGKLVALYLLRLTNGTVEPKRSLIAPINTLAIKAYPRVFGCAPSSE